MSGLLARRRETLQGGRAGRVLVGHNENRLAVGQCQRVDQSCSHRHFGGCLVRVGQEHVETRRHTWGWLGNPVHACLRLRVLKDRVHVLRADPNDQRFCPSIWSFISSLPPIYHSVLAFHHMIFCPRSLSVSLA